MHLKKKLEQGQKCLFFMPDNIKLILWHKKTWIDKRKG